MPFFVLPLLGGALIGLASTWVLLGEGRVVGISGVLGGALPPNASDLPWRATFLGGLFAGGLVAALFAPHLLGAPAGPPGFAPIAGLLVGVGACLSNGCTSGHGVCGCGRLSPRSILATCVFMAIGIATATLVHAWVPA